ncbi:MAG: type II toxin-antitoxin system prevent-host-death family antitoxin [Candidatus Methylomirabilales bacterium]
MAPIDRFVPITKAKNRLLDLTGEVEQNDDVVAITWNGVPATVLASRHVLSHMMRVAYWHQL